MATRLTLGGGERREGTSHCLKSLTRPTGSFPPPPGILNQARSRDDRRKTVLSGEKKQLFQGGKKRRPISTPFPKTCCNQEKKQNLKAATGKKAHTICILRDTARRVRGHEFRPFFMCGLRWPGGQGPLGLLPRTWSFAWCVISSVSTGELYYFLPATHQRRDLCFMLDALVHIFE